LHTLCRPAADGRRPGWVWRDLSWCPDPTMAGDPVVVALEPDELPILMERGAPTASGWAVVALAEVYKDGTPAGAFVELTIQRDGSSVSTYDEIRRFSPLLPGETPPDDFSPG
jgi:hypothetical protein